VVPLEKKGLGIGNQKSDEYTSRKNIKLLETHKPTQSRMSRQRLRVNKMIEQDLLLKVLR
jgi:hypothetical protein